MQVSAIGQDSHRFELEESAKPLVLGGVVIPGCPGLSGNSDADVVLHAVTNAVSGIHGIPVIGKIADELCQKGIRDSGVYLAKALGFLKGHRLIHLSISIEAKRPHLSEHFQGMRVSIARLCGLSVDDVAITATTGENLTAFGRGEGIQVLVIASADRLL
ncbi:MAG: 2-C-methyl-D-erythritol 2,4-cyclodiphosphate synthase [Chitinispirillaceae bacterium]|jgi:2-C-methyl-D-erythritol 2,4-cyclodiphosphate synthase|nr:2-C-methyl-D-erythritol 2,4-cyclodiphosphate synthase [Chitinispirillaceae bacterium]